MKNEKLVSIVLPVFNGAGHMKHSIQSVIDQTYQNWELIIVNDCSTDHTLRIAKEYEKEDSRIRVFSNERNLKLPRTLNVGFAQARGEYLTWTSDDNLYKSNAIDRLAGELDKDPQLVMVYSDYTNIDDNDNVIGEGKLWNPQDIVLGNVCGASFLYTAEVAKKVGTYDANLFLAEDYDYWIRIYRNGRMKHLSDSLYLYRQHDGSLTETRKESIQMQTYKAIEKNFLFLYTDAKKQRRQYQLFDQMIRRALPEKQEEVKEMLVQVDRGYSIYLKKQAIKHNFL